jgi:hypothetical protein
MARKDFREQAMILRPAPTEPSFASPFAQEALARLPLAEAFYTAWAFIAPEGVLEELFHQHRGRCYHDSLSFDELVLLLADAITRHHGSGHRAFSKALERQQLPVSVRAVYGKLARLPLPLAEALLAGLTSRLRRLLPAGLFHSDIPASLRQLSLVVLDGKKIKRAAKRLLATRGRPGKLFGGKLLVAYSPRDGLALAMAADADGEANDIRLMPRVMPLARQAVAGTRLWIADRQFCDLDQPGRFTEQGDHFLIRFSARNGFEADPRRPAAQGVDAGGRVVVQEWGWMGSAGDQRRREVRRITLMRPNGEAVILVTDLLEGQTYPAEDLLAAYRMRWQIEDVFQQITEVFDLRQLIGGTPQATVFQASLCLVIYNVVQLLRGYAAQAAARRAAEAPAPQGQGQPAQAKAEIKRWSSEKLFADLHEELTGLHRVLTGEELLGCLPKELPMEQVRRRLGALLQRGFSPLWEKARDKKPRPTKPKAKQSGAHTSVHKILQQAREKRPVQRK